MKVKLFLMSVIVSLTLGCFSAFAQQEQPPIAAANALFTAQKWAEAAYDEISKTQPNRDAALYQLGMARYRLKQYAPAAKAFESTLLCRTARLLCLI